MTWQQIKAQGTSLMHKLALEMGLSAKNAAYTRFVIIGRSRSGSNLLRSLLNAHPHIEAYGEIFRSQEAMDWDHIGSLKNDKMQQQLWQDPVKFINERVFRPYPKATAAVGFKIFYYHAQDGSWQTVWPYLEQMTSLRVIHIKRRNILETHLSRKRAEVTDSWVNTGGKTEKPIAVTLDYADCLADFERTRGYEEEFDGRFAHHPKIEVIYENLAQDYNAEMTRVQEFLGVPYAPVQPAIFKQSRQTLREAITNYDDLKRQFQLTPWADFFTD
jgi:LPS sulfotransferase NodH